MTRTLTRLLLAAACSAWTLMAADSEDGSAKLSKRTVAASDGLKLVCEVGGQGDTALIFLHGWCGDRAYWKNQVSAFAPDYRVVTMDQAGHGESGKDRDQWTVASLGQDVESVVKALELNRVIVIGHSMGGPVGLIAAKRMPGKIVAVIGVDTIQNAEMKMRQDLAKQYLDALTADFEGSLKGLFAGLLPEQLEPGLKDWIASRAAAQDPKMAIGLMRDMTELEVKTLLAEAKVPVRCINSSGGFAFHTPTAAETNRKYADYKAVLIDNVGHYPMLEKPDEFNRKLREVLKEFDRKRD
jgi:pimeloyl-ACP methyl ester carboxylesterase